MSESLCRQLETKNKSYYSNAIFFALRSNGIKRASKRAHWIGIYSF